MPNTHISYMALAFLVLLAGIGGITLASVLRRTGVMPASSRKYVPHMVLLLTIAVTPMVAGEPPTFAKTVAILVGVVAIWLVGVWLSSKVIPDGSRNSPDTR